MGIKKYILASILLLVAITGYTFSIESGDYRIQIIDQVIILPVAVWIVSPALILFIVTIIHMFYYGFKNYLSNRAIQKDSENLETLIRKRLKGENQTFTFKNDISKEIGNILSKLDIKVQNAEFNSSNKDINETVGYVLSINEGKYVSAKDIKLSNDNPLMQQNIKNRINEDDNFALEVVKQPNVYTSEIIKCAFMKMVEHKSMTTIKKTLVDITLDIDMLKVLVEKDSQDNNEFSLDNTVLLDIIKKVDITNKDLIQIAKEYKKSMTPEQLMKLFEDLVTYNEKLTESYLYVLSEYEMIDDIREILASSQKDEFNIYKAYIDLRDAGKHYTLDTFI